MPYFNECPYCHSALDPGEQCDCNKDKLHYNNRKKKPHYKKRNLTNYSKKEPSNNCVVQPPNEHGYILNITHPVVSDLYYRYLKWKKINGFGDVTVEQRLEFEKMVKPYLVKKGYICTGPEQLKLFVVPPPAPEEQYSKEYLQFIQKQASG